MTKEIIPGWYDTPGAMEMLGEITRKAISKIAKSEGWHSVPVGNGVAHMHRAVDVHEYRDYQIRTRLVKILGWKGRGLYRIEDIDISCPVCDAYAIEWPAPPYLAKKFICINEHKGEL